MIAHWIAYCAAVGLALALAAAALERALRACALPTRWAWLAALLLTLALPAAGRLLPREAALAPARTPAPAGVVAGERVDPASLPLKTVAAPRLDLAALDRPLLLAWGAASAATLLALLAMAALLGRRRARWRPAELAGVPVLLSRDTGPAVVGLLRGRIVLPEWATVVEPAQRDLLLEHELEHLRAGDPRLLAAGLAALVLTPWNPAVWWQLRRLRLAVEIDCDARVLRRRADVRAYGTLLLEMGRRAGGSPLAAAAFSEPTSFLERRIRVMTMPRQRSPRLVAVAFGALGLGLVAAACETPPPTSAAPVPVERVYAAEGAAEGLRAASATPREALARYFPEVLTRGAGGNDAAVFVVSHTGELVSGKLVERGTFAARAEGEGEGEGSHAKIALSSLDDLDVQPERIETMEIMRFQPGQMGPDALAVVFIRLRDPARPLPELRSAPRVAAGDEGKDYSLIVEPGAPAVGIRLRTPAGEQEVRGARLELSGDRITARGGTAEGSSGVELRADEIVVSEGGGAPAGGVKERVPGTDPAEIVRAIERWHPDVARGEAAPGHLWFVLNAAGEVVRSGDDRNQSLGEYTPESIASVEVFKGRSVRVNGRGVQVIWVRLKP